MYLPCTKIQSISAYTRNCGFVSGNSSSMLLIVSGTSTSKYWLESTTRDSYQRQITAEHPDLYMIGLARHAGNQVRFLQLGKPHNAT